MRIVLCLLAMTAVYGQNARSSVRTTDGRQPETDAADYWSHYVQTVDSFPSAAPSAKPSAEPSPEPSAKPSREPSAKPSREPSAKPSREPSAKPSREPSAKPSREPSAKPSREPSAKPSREPSIAPSAAPSIKPSAAPSSAPSANPSAAPSLAPSAKPSAAPSIAPSAKPSAAPSAAPSSKPSAAPSSAPSDTPTLQATTISPTPLPTPPPTPEPTPAPTPQPTPEPTPAPTPQPTPEPTPAPTPQPTPEPTPQPTPQPTPPPVPAPTPFPTPSSPAPTGDCGIDVAVAPECPAIPCNFDRCLERPFRMLFRVDTRTCDQSILRRCPGVDPDTCSCIRDTVLPPDAWAEQKFTCTDLNGGPPPAGTPGTFWVEATPSKDTSVIYFQGPVTTPGGQFNAVAPAGEDRVAADTFLNLYACNNAACTGPGALLQQVLFHSSCSQQLYLLDIFGSFQLIEFESTTQGVIGFGISPTVGFTLQLNAAVNDGPVSLDFLSIVVLSESAGLLPPQIFNIPVSGRVIPPPFTTDTTINLVIGQPFNVITTIGGTVGGLGCFDVSNATIRCDATIEPGPGTPSKKKDSKKKNKGDSKKKDSKKDDTKKDKGRRTERRLFL